MRQITPIPLKHSPSLLHNNLGYGSGLLCYSHKYEVYLVNVKHASSVSVLPSPTLTANNSTAPISELPNANYGIVAMVPKNDTVLVFSTEIVAFENGAISIIVLATKKGVEVCSNRRRGGKKIKRKTIIIVIIIFSPPRV